MQSSLCLLLFLSLNACIWAYPNPQLVIPDLVDYEPAAQLVENYDWAPSEAEELQHRVRSQLNIQGGGSGRQGFDLSVNGRAPVWQSPNGRHSLDATGQYSQHLGGPYGNSRPNWGAGAVYTFRF